MRAFRREQALTWREVLADARFSRISHGLEACAYVRLLLQLAKYK
jgi:hypothetical protein